MSMDCFLKFEDSKNKVEGETKQKGHEKEIEILSWSHGFTQPTSPVRSTAGGGTVEKASHSELSVSKMADASTPALIRHCWSGTHFAKVILSQFRSAGTGSTEAEVEYLKIEMEDVIISHYGISSGGGDLPVESMSLNYGKITYNYNPADQKTGAGAGNNATTHDLVTNTIS